MFLAASTHRSFNLHTRAITSSQQQQQHGRDGGNDEVAAIVAAGWSAAASGRSPGTGGTGMNRRHWRTPPHRYR